MGLVLLVLSCRRGILSPNPRRLRDLGVVRDVLLQCFFSVVLGFASLCFAPDDSRHQLVTFSTFPMTHAVFQLSLAVDSSRKVSMPQSGEMSEEDRPRFVPIHREETPVSPSRSAFS